MAAENEVKPDETLKDFLRARLDAEHGSVLQATAAAGLPYERIKKALQRDSIKKGDLEKLIKATKSISELDVADLDRMYPGKITQLHRAEKESETYSKDDKFNAALSDMYKFYPRLRSLAQSTLYDQVNTLYDNWPNGMVMALFCHARNAIPLEWDSANRQARHNLKTVLMAGGSVIYVLEAGSEEGDDFDDEFEHLAAQLADAEKDPHDKFSVAEPALVGLLRVPECPFCLPFAKPTLFAAPEDGDGGSESGDDGQFADIARRAIMALEIPETIDGKGKAGTMFIPQGEEMAREMQGFINRSTRALLRGDQGYRWSSFPSFDSVREPVSRIGKLI